METIPPLKPREELIEYLNFKRFNMKEISIKDIIEEDIGKYINPERASIMQNSIILRWAKSKH